MIAAKSARRH